jgi:alpha-N-arabinofuranosidase
MPLTRYPGGNFVSGFNWQDAIGPQSERPFRADYAWKGIEPNTIGIDEFIKWCKDVNTEIVYTVNLGTNTPKAAQEVVEYCNFEKGTYFSDLRRKNGSEKPHNIKYWCLGNEMDGEWQIGHKTAEEYGRVATETAKVLKWVDPTIELVACGSSDPNMPSYGEWERTVLEHTYDYVDYLSLHCYYGNRDGNTKNFLARAEDMDRFIKKTSSICDEIKEKKNSDKTIMLSFDEWNVWYRTKDEEKQMERWQIAPHLLEEKYNFEDALLVGCMLSTLQNNADRVKVGCLAQLVNVIAPIMTENGGRVWKQTIFYPYMYASLYGNGTALKSAIECDSYKSNEGWDISYLCSSVIDCGDSVVVFATNRCLDSDISLSLELNGYDGYKLCEHIELYGELDAINDKEKEEIKPVKCEISDTPTLKKHSWNMLVYKNGMLQ